MQKEAMTTEHRRWTVRIHQSHRNGAKCPKSRWVVDPPGFDYKKRAEHTGNWHRAGGNWFQWDRERTKREAWKEALAYADRRARTVEVTAPRVVDDCVPVPGSPKPAREATWIAPSRDGGCWITMPTAGYIPIMVRKEELAPLALALLAHHYRREAQ